MRYLPQTKESRKAMMDAIGVKSVDELYKDVPKSAFIDGLADLPLHMGETTGSSTRLPMPAASIRTIPGSTTAGPRSRTTRRVLS